MPTLIHIEKLTGPPSINGVIVPYPNNRTGLFPVWVPEHKIKKMYDFSTKIKERRFRAVFRLGWKGLTKEEYETILNAIEETSFTFIPRTQAAGETDPVNSYTVYCTSIIPFDSFGRIIGGGYDLEIELRSTAVERERGGTLWSRIAPRLVKSYSKVFAPTFAYGGKEITPSIVRAYSKIFSPEYQGTAIGIAPSLVRSFSKAFSPDYISQAITPTLVRSYSKVVGAPTYSTEILIAAPYVIWTVEQTTIADSGIWRTKTQVAGNPVKIHPAAFSNLASRGIAVRNEEVSRPLFYVAYTGGEGFNRLMRSEANGSDEIQIHYTGSGNHVYDLAVSEDYIFYIFTGAVRRVNHDATGDIAVASTSGTGSVEVYEAAQKIYVVDGSNSNIKRYNYDGTGEETIYTDASASSRIALDIPAGHIYISDEGRSAVYRINLDTVGQVFADATLIKQLLFIPGGITVDLENIYVTDRDGGRIYSMAKDGSTFGELPNQTNAGVSFTAAVDYSELEGELFTPTIVRAYSKVIAPTYTEVPPPIEFTPSKVQSFSKVFAPVYAPQGGAPTPDHEWRADALGLSNNDPVLNWDDTGSGTPINGTGHGPIFLTNIQNGLPAVDFDGVDDWIDLGTALAAESAEYTIVAVFMPDGVAQRGCIIASLHSSGVNTDSKLYLEQGTVGEPASSAGERLGYSFGNGAGAYSWGYTNDLVISPGVAAVVTVRRVTGQSYEEIYVNGVLKGVTQSQALATSAHTNAYQTALGRMGAFAAVHFDGKIMQLQVFNSALATTDREAAENAMLTKYAIP